MRHSLLSRTVLAGAGVAAALLVFSAALPVHLRRACVEMDTPYLPICTPSETKAAGEPSALRERLARNPGESPAWVRLLVQERNPSILAGAALAAPNNHNVARWRAAQLAQSGQVAEGIAVLIDLLRHRPSPDSAQAIARVAASSDAMTLLGPHLSTAHQWLPQVLHANAVLKQPATVLMPLVHGAQEQGRLPEALRQWYMQHLKAGGEWLDAYGLWLASHKDPIPLLYNPSFDSPIVRDGFDWEFTPLPRNRAGLDIEQQPFARRGYVLHVEFLGRSFTSPAARQYVFLSPGGYRVRGEYMATRLRSEQGLAWSVRCLRGAVAGRSAPLSDTGGAWRTFDFGVAVPTDCGPVASLQLEPAADYEAAAGIKGHAYFDAFTLVRQGAQ